MRRYLLVANQTLGGDQLRNKVKECTAEGPCHFYVLVPATTPSGARLRAFNAMAAGEPTPSGQSRWDLARDRLGHELVHLRKLGVNADGEVGDPNPLRAIREVLERRQFDEIILSTLPRHTSRWLAMDLPHRMRRSFKLPVTHITSSVEQEP
jgi:GABA permease